VNGKTPDGKAARPEVYAYGVRNPWRMNFDTKFPHELWDAEVGENAREEVNIIERGKNYGYNLFEGDVCTFRGQAVGCNKAGLTEPQLVLYASDTPGGAMPAGAQRGDSITGGYVYRGADNPNLQGYVFATHPRRDLRVPEGYEPATQDLDWASRSRRSRRIRKRARIVAHHIRSRPARRRTARSQLRTPPASRRGPASSRTTSSSAPTARATRSPHVPTTRRSCRTATSTPTRSPTGRPITSARSRSCRRCIATSGT
jgi:hypothetical protein